MKEEEIRKRDVFNKYLEMVEKDVKAFFDLSTFDEAECPACEGRKFTKEFEKNGFCYVSCEDCSTLFVNPRPPFAVLKEFYSKSPSTNFWVNEFFKPVAEVRREKIFIPRAQYISNVIVSGNDMLIGDIGSGFGLFLEELRKLLPNNHYIAIEPSEEMADICSSKGLDIRCSCLEDIKGMDEKFDFLTTFELTEHLYDPYDFFNKVYSLLKPGGHLFLTTLNSRGFDILTLWEKSKSIMPPHHLNFFNPRSIRHLLERVGFSVNEVSTPGELDWDIVEGMIRNEKAQVGKFWDILAFEGDTESKKELQSWITKNNLSSHMRVLARKQNINF